MLLSIALFSLALDFAVASTLPLVSVGCAFVPVEHSKRFGYLVDRCISQLIDNRRSSSGGRQGFATQDVVRGCPIGAVLSMVG